jgi:hypothetical protein
MQIAYHLDLNKSFIAIIQQIVCFPAIDSDYTQEKLTGKSQSHRRLVWCDDGLHTVLDAGL